MKQYSLNQYLFDVMFGMFQNDFEGSKMILKVFRENIEYIYIELQLVQHDCLACYFFYHYFDLIRQNISYGDIP